MHAEGALTPIEDRILRMDRLAELGRLAGGMAHQIRNPLGVIANASHLLAKLTLHDATASEVVQIIQDEVRRANRIVADLLDCARLRKPLRRAVPVDDLVTRALEAQQVPTRVQIVRDVPALPEVSVDDAQVEGALGNLIQNAIESMPNGGTLTVAARCQGDDVVISVEDTGVGIATEVLGRLFEPLVTTKPSGTGLGLSTARAFIENQGGAIACSTGMTGTRFDVRLPCSAESERRAVA